MAGRGWVGALGGDVDGITTDNKDPSQIIKVK